MRKRTVAAVIAGLALGVAPGVIPLAFAARWVQIDLCIVDRNPTAALAQLTEDNSLFELDLRSLKYTPFALKTGECVRVEGLDRDNEPALRREFPQGLWLVEAYTVAPLPPEPRRRGAGNPNEDDKK